MKIKENISLKDYSTIRIGGTSKYFVEVNNKEDLKKLIDEIDMPFRILGCGSNTLINEDFNGLTIIFKTTKPEILVEDKGCSGLVYTESSVLLSFLISKLKEFVGLEWGVGIPGTLGGAINGNAGAFNQSIGDNIVSVEVLEVGKGIKEFKNKDCKFGYRTSIFKNNPRLIILSAKFNLSKGSPVKKIKENIEKRRNNYPYGFSLGSVFKNYYGEVDASIFKKYPKIKEYYDKKGYVSAGMLIEECGLKGFSIGDAQISTQHANFIINKQNAKAENVLKLINFIKKEVKKKFLIDLEEEIQIFSSLTIDK